MRSTFSLDSENGNEEEEEERCKRSVVRFNFSHKQLNNTTINCTILFLKILYIYITSYESILNYLTLFVKEITNINDFFIRLFAVHTQHTHNYFV